LISHYRLAAEQSTDIVLKVKGRAGTSIFIRTAHRDQHCHVVKRTRNLISYYHSNYIGNYKIVNDFFKQFSILVISVISIQRFLPPKMVNCENEIVLAVE
jgi:hypothetical protein